LTTDSTDLEREKFDEAKLYTAYQNKIQKKLIKKGVRKIGAIASLAAFGIASAGVVDYYLLNTNITEEVLSKAESSAEYLMQPNPNSESNLPRLLEDIKPGRALSIGVSGIAILTLGTMGINAAVSKKYTKKNNIVEAVFGVPHKDQNSEIEMYKSLTGKPGHMWHKERQDYFETLAEWAKIEMLSECLHDDNYLIEGSVPKEALEAKQYRRPTLDEIVEGLGKRDDRKPMELPEKKGARLSFTLPHQPNQLQQYFEGYVFDSLDTQDFVGYDVILKKLSSGKWIMGTCGPKEVKPTSIFSRNKLKEIEKQIKNEALFSQYFCVPSDKALSIALISEGTYPVQRGGVATLVNEMMAELIPAYFKNQEVHFEAVSHLANTGPYKTKISYNIPRNVHLNPPILIYGYTMNPTLEIKKELPESGDLFERKKGMSKSKRRHTEIKNTIALLEQAIESCDMPLFYKVADRMQYFSSEELLISSATLEFLYEQYHKTTDADKPDFQRFQYQWRNVRQPLVNVVKSEKVKADVYYCVATGVSGVYSALAQRQFNCGLVLTEHGIYLEDRVVDLANSPLHSFAKKTWIKTLEFYSKLVYDAAHSITTTCASNYYKQLRDGAPKEKLKLIAGSVHIVEKIPEFNDPGLKDPASFQVGMLGNVQRVKRVELFIATADYLNTQHSKIKWKFGVMGMDDNNDKRYVEQIHTLVEKNPNLNNFEFSPYTSYVQAFAPLDTGVLMSSSEVQPRSIMEFLSLGKPMIGLDVGGIDELINGTGVDNYGPGGLVCEVGTAEKVVKGVADAILTLYLRKHLLLTGKKSSIPEPEDSKLSYLLEQKMPMEKVGPRRMAESYDFRKIMPLYAQEYMDSIVKAREAMKK
jgi:glycosyltransferase involved in cell wall biosynthesis